jgi:hypothetical protein
LCLAAWLGWGVAFPEGHLVLETEDATDAEALRGRMEHLYLYEPQTDRAYPVCLGSQTLPVGTYEWKKTAGAEDVRFATGAVTIERADPAHVRVWVEGKVSPKWIAALAALTPADRLDAVLQKLRDRNPGFEGPCPTRIREGKVVELNLVTDHVTDLSPVQALKRLDRLTCAGSRADAGKLADLMPLQELGLTSLDCSRNPGVVSLEPLRGMPLCRLDCSGTGVDDLGPLKDMWLSSLNCTGCPIDDLTALAAMPLQELHCEGTRVTDFTPLKYRPLRELSVDPSTVKELGVLRGSMTLQVINGKPAAEFWKELEARK